MPDGLEPLFEKIFSSIDPGDRAMSDRVLLLLATNRSVNALHLTWLADLEDPDFPFSALIQPIQTTRSAVDMRRFVACLTA